MKKIFSKIKFYPVLCILSFGLGCFFFFASQGDPFFVRCKILLVGFGPCLFFSFLTFLDKKLHKQKAKITINCLFILATLSLWIYYPVALFIGAALEFGHPITNVKSYKYKGQGDWLFQAFPKEIPKSSRNVQFWYEPGFLQAGTSYSLYYIDPDLDVETFKTTYSEKALKTSYVDNNKFGIFSHTPVEEKNKKYFYIYVIQDRCDDSGYCNHGEYLIVAINENTKEIIYKGAYW